ncbi:isoprenoid synthase domain-containing protein [Coprinopsis sp. MPI-PUGE-AT-0042]|nr:isoprenoid synthase domain-containing protein [Coprinopsis sp. MPI-PUGE-AT-0042]
MISRHIERTGRIFLQAGPLVTRHCRRSTRAFATDADSGIANPAAYCKDLVRKHDYESFLVSPFYPKAKQDAYFAIKAFAVELATIQDHVSNPMIGKMRMQFWKDAVKDISAGRSPKHPIALALLRASESANLPAYHFKRIIDARATELETPSHLTIDTLTSHAESTSSTVLYLLLSLFSLPSSALSHAASHLGVAQTFATLLRALPYHATKGRIVIPAEITARHGVNQQDVFRRGPGAEGLEDAAFEFATIANDHMITARDMFKQEGMDGTIPQAAMPIFLSGVPTASYLSRLEKSNFDAFDRQLQLRDWKLPWQIWRSYYKKMF